MPSSFSKQSVKVVWCTLRVFGVSTLGGGLMQNVWCLGRFPCNRQHDDLLSIPERELPEMKQNYEDVLVSKTLLQVDIIYKPSERITLSDAQEAGGWQWWNIKMMKMIFIALVVTRIEINLLKTWHAISMTYTLAIIRVFQYYRLSENCVPSTAWSNAILWLLLEVIFKPESHPYRELSS